VSTPIRDAAPIAVLASRVRVEEKLLFEALRRRGCPAEQVDTRRLSRQLGSGPARWPLVLNREISATRGRYAALMLEAGGATVVNSAVATSTCGDKWLTSLALHRAGVPTPSTALALTPEAAAEHIGAIGCPVVVKPLGSSWGRRVSLLRDEHAVEAVLEHCAALPSPQAHIVYIQELIDKPGRDIRVVVVGGRAIGAAYRYSTHWRTNVARGAEARPCPLGAGLAGLAENAARAVAADVAGVDVVEDATGRMLVLEVNAGVEFAGLQHALGGAADIAAAIADLVADRYAARTGGGRR
jgi:[lysine-biosynthesis-protein LysW]--L-2-aminoadipate ligase